MVGTRVGAYEVTSSLGEGGMGEVYRARDTKLNRDVAIKVVRTAFTADPDRRARFTREAHILALLNHPNIAHVYGLEETTDGVPAIVMELVDGPTLADRLSRGPLAWDEARPIIDQLISALEAAHEQAIVHRDLKPANIKVRSDGTLKVLDFGLAKAAEPIGGSGFDMANSPTMTNRATQLGLVLGTAAYMAPEQAKGKPIDKRADIWSFGVVVYEMLTGRRAFEAEDVSETLAAVLTREIDPSALPASVPESARALVSQCLVRDPKQRLRDIGDARLILNRPHAPMAPNIAVARGSQVPWLVAALALAAAVTMGLMLWRGSPPVTDAPVRRLALSFPENVAQVSISPDGDWLLYVPTRDGPAKVRRLDGDTAEWKELSGTEAGVRYFWSPDSRQVAFGQGQALKTVDLIGSKPRTLCSDCLLSFFRGGTWNREGIIVFADPRLPLRAVSAAGGDVRTVSKIDTARQETEHLYPVFLPDGKRFLFVARNKTGDHSIMLGSLDTTEATRIAPGETLMAIAAGQLLSVRNGALVAVPFDATEGKVGAVTGVPIVIERDVRTGTGGYASFSASDDGTVVSIASPVEAYWWVDAKGTKVEKLNLSRTADVRIAPDGSRLVISDIDPATGANDIYVTNPSGGDRSRVTFDPEWDQSPVWSPTGKEVMFTSQRDLPRIGLYVRTVDTAEKERRVYAQEGTLSPTDWSPDGNHVLLSGRVSGGAPGIYSLNVAAATLTPWQTTDRMEISGRFSPDGAWVAFQSFATANSQIYVRKFAGVSEAVPVTTAGGMRPVWSKDGKSLFYRSLQGRVMTVSVQTKPSLSIGQPHAVFSEGSLAGSTVLFFEIDNTGRFLVRLREQSAQNVASAIFNWPALLKVSRP